MPTPDTRPGSFNASGAQQEFNYKRDILDAVRSGGRV